jgi:hypothetical protein
LEAGKLEGYQGQEAKKLPGQEAKKWRSEEVEKRRNEEVETLRNKIAGKLESLKAEALTGRPTAESS